ncbi:hypothetical protein [Marininema halotolerans]|uniref:Uncharacterized protein n=1 Tax=Marininema halotolerans TaxID=1155944 RepID=A0A1I6UQN3_9BACL|nr:hypothetical protein [Marininema halotolerans]SFT03751.1 hypothetical protein SAMN05444972_11911 [Marininema halotolerans]
MDWEWEMEHHFIEEDELYEELMYLEYVVYPQMDKEEQKKEPTA